MGWEKSALLDGEVPDAVARIKDAHDEVHTIGSADLVQTLLRHDLVDRFELVLYPVLLGTGKRLFAEGTAPTAPRVAVSAELPAGREAPLREHGRHRLRSTPQRRVGRQGRMLNP